MGVVVKLDGGRLYCARFLSRYASASRACIVGCPGRTYARSLQKPNGRSDEQQSVKLNGNSDAQFERDIAIYAKSRSHISLNELQVQAPPVRDAEQVRTP